MEPRVNYALVGLFVIVLVAGMIAAGLWLTTGLETGNYRRYAVYMDEAAFGLGADSKVVYYGVGVGKVLEAELMDREGSNVRTVIRVSADTPVSEGTVASLKVRGVTGIAYIELTGGKKDAPPLRMPPGEPYPVIPYESSLITRLDEAVTDGMDTLENIGNRIDALLSPANIARIEATLVNVERLTGDLDKTSKQLRETLAEIDATASAGTEAAEEAKVLLGKADGTLDELNRMAASIEAAGEDVSSLSSNGDAVMGQMESTTLPQIQALAAELQLAAKSLRRLSESLEENPSQVIFGPSRKDRGPGEGSEP